jgi:DNA-binding response OmpR family regulator
MGEGKILIVDDEVEGRHLLSEVCRSIGYEVECAVNGADALAFLERAVYNLVIVDYMMPKMNGVEFVKKARERWTSLPIIAMSAVDAEDLFIKAGAELFLQKPFNYKILEKEIETMMLK